MGWDLNRDLEMNAVGLLVRLLAAVGLLWTASLLHRRRRLGGLLGLCSFGLMILQRLLSGQRISVDGLIIPVAGALALALAWTHLTEEPSAQG